MDSKPARPIVTDAGGGLGSFAIRSLTAGACLAALTLTLTLAAAQSLAQGDGLRRDLAFPPQPPAPAITIAATGPEQARAMGKALFESILRSDTKELESLAKQGVHLTARNDDGEPPLYVAAEHGSVDVVALLLRERCDPRLRTPNGETALHAAAMRGDPAVIKLLLNAGAQPNSLNRNGETPLAWAAMTGTLNATLMLLESGAVVNAVDENGNTPLHGAAAAGHADIVQLLLSRKADATRRNRDGLTARELARERDQDDAVRVLPP